MDPNTIPEELKKAIGDESVDFVVQSGLREPRGNSNMGLVGGSLVLSLFAIIFIIILINPNALYVKNRKNVKIKQEPKDIIFNPITILFIFAGSTLVIKSAKNLIKPGGLFAGTPTRLIKFQEGSIESFQWNQFIDVSSHYYYHNRCKKDIMFKLWNTEANKGRNQFYYNRKESYIPEIDDDTAIESVIKKRIDEANLALEELVLSENKKLLNEDFHFNSNLENIDGKSSILRYGSFYILVTLISHIFAMMIMSIILFLFFASTKIKTAFIFWVFFILWSFYAIFQLFKKRYFILYDKIIVKTQRDEEIILYKDIKRIELKKNLFSYDILLHLDSSKRFVVLRHIGKINEELRVMKMNYMLNTNKDFNF
jgi:energy-coupling factor transporter transmembrane protein EcfT